VARAKRELVEALPANGVAILNADDARVTAMAAAAPGDVVSYGRGGDVRLVGLALDDLARAAFTVETPWGRHDVRLSVSGAHMAMNAAAAIAVAGVVEGSVDDAVAALETATVSGMRMEVGRTSSGAVIVNDAYNANPDSMRAALDAVAAMAAQRRFAVLGPMAELDDPAAGHRRVMDDARRRGIDVVAFKTDLYGVDPVADPVTVLGRLGAGDVVLVKASRAGGLEEIAAQLLTT
jgi:UDP-N-acetylmuramoyl-tripeptide--D-alanyl-D-alanine ligase